MRDILLRFTGDRRGSIGLYMAVAILPITLLVGAATDLRRVETMRMQAQDASDAASLAAAKAYWSTVGSPDQRLAAARMAAGRALNANLLRAGSAEGGMPADLSAFDWDVARGDLGELKLVARATVPLAFGGLFRMEDASFNVRSTANAVPKNLELALVLDNTGSMNERGKIGILREATASMLDQLNLAAEANPDEANRLKVALVPFSMTVRLDPAEHAAAPWLDWTPAHASYRVTNAPADWSRRAAHEAAGGWRGCVENRPSDGGLDIAEGLPPTEHGAYVPFTNPDPVSSGQGTVVEDPNRGCGLLPITPLTSDVDAVKAAALAMRGDGNTNIPFGMAWGWHAIAPQGVGPIGRGVAYDDKRTVKAVLLMTDGTNVVSDDGPYGGPYSGLGRPDQGRIAGIGPGTSEDERRRVLDARLEALCENMKARKLAIYTVRLVEGPVDTLRGCASESGGFYDVQRAEDLPEVFSDIARDLLDLRLSG